MAAAAVQWLSTDAATLLHAAVQRLLLLCKRGFCVERSWHGMAGDADRMNAEL